MGGLIECPGKYAAVGVGVQIVFSTTSLSLAQSGGREQGRDAQPLDRSSSLFFSSSSLSLLLSSSQLKTNKQYIVPVNLRPG